MKKVLEFSVKYPIWGHMLILLIGGLGLISLSQMNVNFFPEIEARNVGITVAYPGASPQEMEEGVVLKIEQSLRGIQGVEQMTSISSENFASITVEGLKGYDPDILLSEVKNAVDRINSFPVAAEKPVVFRIKPLERVVVLLLKGNVDLLTLKKNAQYIEDDLLATGVATQVTLSGIPDYEFAVQVTEETLRRHALTMDEIAQAIRRNNLDLSAGSIKSDAEEILIRSRNKRFDPHSIGEIVVRKLPTGGALRVRDVAQVREQFAEVPNKNIYNGEPSVSIVINKTPEEDLLAIAERAGVYAAQFNAQNSVLELVVSGDRSKVIRQRIDLLQRNGLQGLILVVLSLTIFMNLRLSLWVAFSIPVSFLGMFIVANLAGATINVISLFGMILVVGILVDDGVVVSENIYTHYEKGKSHFAAAIDGTSEVILSVFASVSTTIVMFLPFFFLDGRLGEAFWQMAAVVVACLSISMLEASFMIPAHLAHSKALTRKEPNRVRKWLTARLDYLRERIYGRSLHYILNHKLLVLSAATAFMLIVIGMMRGGIIRTTFFPFVDGDNIAIDLQLKPGSRETETEKVLKEIETKVWQVNEELSAKRTDGLKIVLSTRLEIGGGGSERGFIDVELLDGETRDLESFKISSAIRQKVGVVPEADLLTFGARQIFGKPVALSMVGSDLAALEAAKEQMKRELAEFPMLKDINDNNRPGKRELKLKLKPLAYALGLTTQEIGRQIRQGFFGEEAQRLQIGRDEVRVWVRYPVSERQNLGQLESVRIKVGGREFPLTELAEYTIERGIVNINHYNGAREVRIEADLADQNEPVPAILEKIKSEVVPKVVGSHAGVRVLFEGQDKENQKFARSAQKAFPLALAVLMIIIVLTFRSWSQMALIIFMVPLGIFGAFLGHWIENKPVSVFSFYGIIALIGIVVNNTIVFLDKYNRDLVNGMTVREAAFSAGMSRFRAIVLTSFTTVVGLYPLLLEKSRQAQFLIPMAVSIAWGVVFSTIFALTVFPAMILVANDVRRWSIRVFRGHLPMPEQVEPAIRELREIEYEKTH